MVYKTLESMASKNIFRTLCEQAADGIFLVNLKGVILYANRSAERIVKIPHLSYARKHFERYVDKESLDKTRKVFLKVKSGEKVVRDEICVLNSKKKSIPVEFTAAPIVEKGKIILIHAIIRDISRRKELEEVMNESEKMKTIQHFVSGTASEIVHPIKGLYDNSHRLIKEYKTRDFEYIGFKEFQEIIAGLETMRDQAKYCFDTTQRLISLNKRKVKLHQRKSHINEIVKEAISLVGHNLNVEDIQLKVKLDSGIPKVLIDPSELNQVLVNIFTNAIQSIQNQGEVVIKTRHNRKSHKVVIECCDNGIGIPKEIIKRIFDPFFTTKNRGLEKSSGLGLSIAYSIIKSYKGDISIKSNLRNGTAVKIVIPLDKAKKK